MRQIQLSVSILMVWAGGCGPAAIRGPDFRPSAAAGQAIEQFDASGNGVLEAAELAKVPGLASALRLADTDASGSLSREEIAARIEAYRTSQIGLMSFQCTVYLDQQPLAGAEVKLVPEAFLAEAIQPATGITSEAGNASPLIAGGEFPAVQCGIYRVEISKKDASGAETLPSKYNTHTELGQEISPDVPNLERGVIYRLSSQ